MRSLICGTCLVLLVGCGSGVEPPPELPTLVKVTGQIKLDGKPLDGAAVMFMPTGNSGYAAVGGTDADGKYSVQTRTGSVVHDGVPPGSYKVVISRMVKPDGSPIQPDPETPPAMQGGRESLPPKYSSPVQSTLTAEVNEAKSNFDFELTPQKPQK